MEPVRVGIIGCGAISPAYLRTIANLDILHVVACADVIGERARTCASEFNIPKACSIDDLLADPQIELVLNLTIPSAHAEVAEAALQAGKSVYNEKPLATTRPQGSRLLELARQRGLLIGCAPDTFLGGGLQTCRALIDQGAIGEPLAATAFMMTHGPEHWHPNPAFFYEPGGGPLFDMGPYYLTALIHLLGPIRRVSGAARISLSERIITSQPLDGAKITVKTPTHITGVLEFTSGAIGNLITSFDVWGHRLPSIEIYGTQGTLAVPDPNTFAGPVLLLRAHSKEWTEMPLSHAYTGNSRGIGVADMAYALRTGRPQRASGELAYHVLDCMESLLDSAQKGMHVELQSTCTRPAPLPTDLPERTLSL